MREITGTGEIIVSPIGWSSDISAVFAAGFKPVFVDVDLKNLALDEDAVLNAINDQTRAVLLVHVLGFNGLSQRLLDELEKRNIPLFEDVCESHGASFMGKKVGTFGLASNFSFFYAHHMSTIEGGMICTNDDNFYELCRMFRSHGMTREMTDQSLKDSIAQQHPGLYPEFTFQVPGYNMRSTEINAVIGLNQLKRLDENNKKRIANWNLFISHLDPNIYYTDFNSEGSVNYALVVLLRDANSEKFNDVVKLLHDEGVEYRRGTAGGGNLARQPFVRNRLSEIDPSQLINAEKIHYSGLYIGNYPGLEQKKILALCDLLNSL